MSRDGEFMNECKQLLKREADKERDNVTYYLGQIYTAWGDGYEVEARRFIEEALKHLRRLEAYNMLLYRIQE